MSTLGYCNHAINYERWKTRSVRVGEIAIGGTNPIRVQSMTTTDTMDTMATVEETLRMVAAGCEIVRITAPSKKEAENLRNIKDELRKRGCTVPLVADIHFTPNAAEIAATIVEKVRINPGNYADKKKFENHQYTEESYREELQRIEARFVPLITICKQHGTAMRIGTNHGSLSDRIMSRYGDTPLGMVESALEFIRICEKHDYRDLVVSMKSSNTQVMVQAYRLLVEKMKEEGMNYPLHLGVTEAGDGEDGRIKSAVGIGTLLLDGLGDTVRVSLTEDPEFEPPVAQKLIRNIPFSNPVHPLPDPAQWIHTPTTYQRQISHPVHNIGDHEVPRVIADLSHLPKITPASLFQVGYNYSAPLDKWNVQDVASDYVYVGQHSVDFALPGPIGIIQDLPYWEGKEQHYPIVSVRDLAACSAETPLIFVRLNVEELRETIPSLPSHAVVILSADEKRWMPNIRWAVNTLRQNGIRQPLLFEKQYPSNGDAEIFQLDAASEMGALLIDGMGDGLFLQATDLKPTLIQNTAFGILQASRTRISKTEYISCPSCGRTLFDLQETTAKIRKVTDHLKGVKIGIMGCIVNGPGEMADADYGYVGSGPGKINLYKEKEVIKRNVPSEEAVDELINLIREHGDWVEPSLA